LIKTVNVNEYRWDVPMVGNLYCQGMQNII